MERKKRKSNLIIIGVVIVILWGIGMIIKDDKPKSKGFERYNEDLLKIRMKRFAENLISEKLKAPTTAKFEHINYTHKGNDIMMKGYVDAQNALGVPLRSNWYVVINFTGITKADLDSSHKYKILVNELVEL
jgi:hypothetical protein